MKVGVAIVDVTGGLLAADRDPGRAARARRDRPRPAGRGLALPVRAGLARQPAPALVAGGQPRAARQRPPRSCRTSRSGPPTADRDRGRQRRQFARLCARARPGLAEDARFATNPARVAHRDELVPARPALRGGAGGERIVALFAPRRRPGGPISGVDEAFAYAEELGMEPVEEIDGLPLIRPPLRIDGERPPIRHAPPPALDEHGDEIRDVAREPVAAMACRIVFGSMKRTSSRSTSNSSTWSVPRARKKSTSRAPGLPGRSRPRRCRRRACPRATPPGPASRCRSGALGRRSRARRRRGAASSRSSASR